MRGLQILIAIGVALPAATFAGAQPSHPAPAGATTPAAGRAVVAEVRRILAERYVLPERRPALDAILAQGLASGRYDVADPGALAERINADLDTAGHDRHLNFSFDPQRAADLAAASDSNAQPDQSAFERQAREANHGIREMRLMPGNVRYLAYDGFIWTGPESAAAIDTAMRFLSGGDAVIIDLRRNGGGSPAAVQYMISHFLPADRPLVSFTFNGQASDDRLSTLATLPAGRMVGKPLYVLTSGSTASAAEEFTGHVGGYRIGELVGETTAGAGFRNVVLPIAGRYALSVSVGRAVLASTGRDWEAVGLAPTIPTAVPAALDTAYLGALRRLAAAAPAPQRPRLEALADGVAARSDPRAAALALAAYAGNYGERVILVDGDRLYYRRGRRPPTALIALGSNRFALDSDPATRLDFEVAEGRVMAFDMGAAGEPSQGRYARTE